MSNNKKLKNGNSNPVLNSNEDKTATIPTVVKPETKSKRLNLLIYPSLLKDIKKIATVKRTSVNDLINTVLGEYIQTEATKIKRYDDFFKDQD